MSAIQSGIQYGVLLSICALGVEAQDVHALLPVDPNLAPPIDVSGRHAPSAGKPPMSIAVVNRSSVVSDADVARWTAAIARQVHEDVAPVWKIDAEIAFRQDPPEDAWICTIDDTSDAATEPGLTVSTLGTHQLGDDGKPRCQVNAGLIVSSHLGAVSTALSHEILEMIANPWMTSVTFVTGSAPNLLTAYLTEICDPVSGYSYEIDGVAVSDFTFPGFWQSGPQRTAAKLDRSGAVTHPLEPAPHSYLLVRNVTSYGGNTWNFLWGSYCLFGPC